jgi:hypothetical protein
MTKSALTPLCALAFCLASIAASGVAAGAQPSYDCGKAVTPTEKAICVNDALAGLDRAIAAAFHQLKTELALVEEKPLAAEQTDFLKMRDACRADRTCLLRAMENWRDALRLEPHKARNDRRERFVGRYESKHGWAMVRRTFAGDYDFIANQAHPEGRWVCDVHGKLGKVEKGSRAVATIRNEDGDKQTYEIHVAMKRAGLVLEEGEPRLAGAFCGHNGSIEGSYRRVRKLNVSGEG